MKLYYNIALFFMITCNFYVMLWCGVSAGWRSRKKWWKNTLNIYYNSHFVEEDEENRNYIEEDKHIHGTELSNAVWRIGRRKIDVL